MPKSSKHDVLHHILLENMMKNSSQSYQTRSLAMTVVENGFESEVLSESVVKNIAKDILQFLVAGAAEYGLDVATLGAGAAGPSEAAAVIIDTLFAIETIASSIKGIDEIVESSGKFFKEAMNVAKGSGIQDLDAFYDSIKVIVQKGVKLLSAESSIDKVAKSIKDKVGELIGKFVDALVAGIKTLIPDAAIGLAVSQALRVAIGALADNAFTLFKGAINKAGEYANFITDPKVAPEFFSNALKALSKMCDDMKKKVQDTSWLKVGAAVVGTAGAGTPLAALKAGGPTLLDKIKGQIDEKAPKVVELIKTIVSVVLPGAACALAIYQIMMKGEYKEETAGAPKKEEKTEEAPKKEEKTEEAPAAASKKEESRERYLPLGTLMSEYSYKRNKEKNILLYEWAVTGKKNYKAY